MAVTLSSALPASFRARCITGSFLVLGWLTCGALPGQGEADAEAPQQGVTDSRLRTIFDGDAPANPAELLAMQSHVQALIDRVLPSVVSFGNASGVVIPGGWVLTAGHVIDTVGKDVRMTLHDGRRIEGVSCGVNHLTDTGLVRITTEGEFPAVPLGQSNSLARGEWCLMLGHPSGAKNGRSAPARLGRIVRSDRRRSFITSDCPMQGGDSGGPLFDMDGEIIGINSRIGSSLANNMHVSAQSFHDEWEDLVAGKVVEAPRRAQNRARIGIRWDRESESARIRAVRADSVGEAAGLEAGDVIVRVGTVAVEGRWEAARQIAALRGNRLTLGIERDGEAIDIEVMFESGEEDEGDKEEVPESPPEPKREGR